MKKIILSIHDKHLANIKSGKKTIELRTTFPKDLVSHENKTQVTIHFYNTKTKKIEFIAHCRFVKLTHLDVILLGNDNICKLACVSKMEFYKYFEKKDVITFYVFEVSGQVKPYSLPEGKKAPQSWCKYETIFEK